MAEWMGSIGPAKIFDQNRKAIVENEWLLRLTLFRWALEQRLAKPNNKVEEKPAYWGSTGFGEFGA
jgi:hypothetical protein